MSLDALMRRPLSARTLRVLVGGLAAGALLIVGISVASRTWLPGFVLLVLILVGLLAYATVRWPRPMIVLVVLSPILDRYVVAGLLPSGLATITNNLSEALLLGVGLILAVQAWREGRLVEAVRYPSTVAFMAFIAVAAVSAVLNGVPAHISAIGLIFTIDAAACFYLPRLVGFSLRDARAAIGAIVAVIAVAAVVAVAQALLSPTLFGLSPVAGRFGEVYRLASIFGDPNVFGAFLIAAVPFLLLGATRLSPHRLRSAAGAIAFILMLALWLSFSRGSWVALIIGGGVILALLDRRALALGIALVVVSFVTAVTIPRDLLVPRGGSGSVEPEQRPNLVDSTVDRIETVGKGQDLRTLFALNALPILRDHPLVGVGPGRYGGAVANTYPTPIYREYRTNVLFKDPTQRTIDNFWLHILVEGGVAGFVALLVAAMIPGLRILRSAIDAVGWRRIVLGGTAAATAGLALSSVSTMLLEANSVAFLFWFLLGVGSLLVRTPAQEHRDREMAVEPLSEAG